MTIIRDLPFDEYRKANAVTFHKLLDFEHSPLKYRRRYVTKEARDDHETDAMRVGRASHCLTLEGPEAFAAQYVVQPETYVNEKGEAKPWNANANVCKAWAAGAEARGQTPVSAKEYALMRNLQDAVRQHAAAARILAKGWPEVTIRQEFKEHGLTVQGRLDWLTPELWVPDYKTAADLTPIVRDLEALRLHALTDERSRRSLGYKYVRQLAWYRMLVENEYAEADNARYFLIVAEKEEPFRCGVFEVGKRLLDIAEIENRLSLDRLAECYRKSDWPGGPTEVVAVDYTGPDLEEAM